MKENLAKDELIRDKASFLVSDAHAIPKICAVIDKRTRESGRSERDARFEREFVYQEAHNRYLCYALTDKLTKKFPKLKFRVVCTSLASEVSDHREMIFGNENLLKSLSYEGQVHRLSQLKLWCDHITYWGSRVCFWQLRVKHDNPACAKEMQRNFNMYMLRKEEQWKPSLSDLYSEVELHITIDEETMTRYSKLMDAWRLKYERVYGARQMSAACGRKKQGRHKFQGTNHDWQEDIVRIWLEAMPTLRNLAIPTEFLTALSIRFLILQREFCSIDRRALLPLNVESEEVGDHLDLSFAVIETFQGDTLPIYHNVNEVSATLVEELGFIYASAEDFAKKALANVSRDIFESLYTDLNSKRFPGSDGLDEPLKCATMKYIVSHFGSREFLSNCLCSYKRDFNSKIQSILRTRSNEFFKTQKDGTFEAYKKLWMLDQDRKDTDTQLNDAIAVMKTQAADLLIQTQTLALEMEAELTELTTEKIRSKVWQCKIDYSGVDRPSADNGAHGDQSDMEIDGCEVEQEGQVYLPSPQVTPSRKRQKQQPN